MSLRILLVSNYLPDAQQSMLRFAAMLEEGMSQSGHEVVTIRPNSLLSRLFVVRKFLGKWAGYVDKFVLFAPRLRSASATFDVAHICDHSNSPYRSWIRSRAVVATCHDLLAVRGAMGEDTLCPASAMGRHLQASILSNLAKVSHVACDSSATLADFVRLTGRSPGSSLRTIPLGFEPSFFKLHGAGAIRGPEQAGLEGRPYILHVGSSQPRKNRESILKSVAALTSRAWNGLAVFVGEPLSAGLMDLAASLGIIDRIRDLGALPDSKLAAIYANADALLFPSLFEGFGWPILEAQASGCPVVCSNRTSLPEVAGKAGLIFEPHDADGMANAVLQLEDPVFRRGIVDEGLRNVQNYSVEKMVRGYLELYQTAVEECR